MKEAGEFEQRRKRFFEKMTENSIAIFSSNPVSTMSNDVTYPYRQNSDLYYLSGFVEPNTYLVFEKKDGNQRFTMFVPPRDPLFETWNGRRVGVDKAKDQFGADKSFENGKVEEVLKEILPKYETVYYEIGRNREADDIILPLIRTGYHSRTKEGMGPYTIVNPTAIVEEMRTVKSKHEIEMLRTANRISIEAHRAAIKATKVGMMEYEIEAYYDFQFRKGGAKRAAYPSIIGSGINATILHYVENNCRVEDESLVLADCGAEYEYYASDITRTWPATGKFSEPQKEVYQLVLDVQKECIEMCKPGVIFEDIMNHAIRRLTEGMVKLGLLEGDIDELIEEKKYRRFYMHGLGHWLGIDTHDTSRISLKKTKLKPGMVFTIEPGIYIPDDEDIPEKYRGIGVRIEDDILITETGYENLTAELEKEIADIEELMR